MATPWSSLAVAHRTVRLNESFWKVLQQVSQTAYKEKTRRRVRGSSFQRSLYSWRTAPGPRTEVTEKEASAPSKEDLSNRAAQQLNGLLGEVVTGSVQGGKSPL